MSFFTRVLGDPNERELRRLRPLVERINSLEDEMRALSDDDLRGVTADLKQELERGAALDDLLPDAFAAVREASQRTIGMRHFDVQLIGGIVLHEGKIAQMRTGEGKTLVATLPSYLNALEGKGVHIVTVNDYLAKRDREWMGKIHEFLGLSVGVILTTQTPQSAERREAYAADISYGTNNELGFDYLRDNMVPDLVYAVQRPLNYAIVDEVDNILIDEARTPLIISGQAEESVELYERFARIVPRLKAETDYVIDQKGRTVAITEDGIDKIEQMLGVKNVYEDMELTRHLENALKAHALFHNDKEYIVRDGEVLIVDEFTGRVLVGRRYSEGLHQAIEAKEGVKIQRENRTLATITFQNYFRLYRKLAGMTGTAITEAEEFDKIYKLDVVVIPTNKPICRADNSDFIYKSEEGKFQAVVREIKERNERGQPVLVGTTSVENSEYLARLLELEGIAHNVLNAKQHAREALIVAQAGRSGAVTIATNMAGRGTDIKLGGNPDELVEEILRARDIDPEFATAEDRAEALELATRRCDGDRERVIAAGGLYIIGTERHESRRIDNQLRGRSGRQGDPGESRFFVSLQDELMRRFGSDRVAGLMERMGMDDEVPLESKMVSGMLEQAQTKVEAFNFDIRKNVVEYDDVIAKQREVVYADRRRVLEHADMRERVLEMMDHEIRHIVQQHTLANLPEDWDLDGLFSQLEQWGVPFPEEVVPDHINRLRRETLVAELQRLARETYARKEEAVIKAAEEHSALQPGEFYMRQFERAIALHVVDSLWRDHIDHLDVMRSAIGLRTIAQRDPLVEFKREAFEAFDRLKGEIEHLVAEYALRAPINIEIAAPAPEALPKNLKTNAEAIAAASGQAKDAGTATAMRAAGSNGANGSNGSSGAHRANGTSKGASGSAVPTGKQAAGNKVQAKQKSHQGQPGKQPGNASRGAVRTPASAQRTPADANGPQRRGPNGAAHGSGQGLNQGAKPGARAQQVSEPRPASRAVPVGAVSASSAASDASARSGPSRNQPCPCGSGRKYKHCHGRDDG
jgi:preprotein translocase subunit SecA